MKHVTLFANPPVAMGHPFQKLIHPNSIKRIIIIPIVRYNEYNEIGPHCWLP